MNSATPDNADATGNRGGARPRLRTLLVVHVVFTVLNALLFANVMWLMPMLVRLRFGAVDENWRDWQTTLVTASIPTFMMASVFWGELLGRLRLRWYLLIWTAAAAIPYTAVATVSSYWPFLVCQILGSFGQSGWMPLHGRLLKHFYPDHVRGRSFALLSAARLGGAVGSVYLVGTWLETEPNAFRVFFVVAGGLQVIAAGLLWWLIRATRAETSVERTPWRAWGELLAPVLHMGRILRADRVFLRYEIAFMTYGAAFMFCEALLPVLATTRLDMRYEDYAHSTQMVMRATMLVMMLPMGWLLDRLGPVRTSGLAFAILAAYPLLLIFAFDSTGVALACVAFGVGLAGVMMGWMLGPVALAPDSDHVPKYVAIHATLVGVRGVLFQGLSMGLYKLTGGFTVPLVLAVVAFVAAAWQMHALDGAIRRRTVGGEQPAKTGRTAETGG